MVSERETEDWREAIDRLREESNDVLREIWAAKRKGLEESRSEGVREERPPRSDD